MFRSAFAAAICLFALSAATLAASAQYTGTAPTRHNPGETVAPGPLPPAGNVHAGEMVFLQRCSQCHSVTGGEVRYGPSLYHEMRKPKPKKTEAEVREIIKNGKNKMPAWGAILTAENQNDLIAYIHTL